MILAEEKMIGTRFCLSLRRSLEKMGWVSRIGIWFGPTCFPSQLLPSRQSKAIFLMQTVRVSGPRMHVFWCLTPAEAAISVFFSRVLGASFASSRLPSKELRALRGSSFCSFAFWGPGGGWDVAGARVIVRDLPSSRGEKKCWRYKRSSSSFPTSDR